MSAMSAYASHYTSGFASCLSCLGFPPSSPHPYYPRYYPNESRFRSLVVRITTMVKFTSVVDPRTRSLSPAICILFCPSSSRMSTARNRAGIDRRISPWNPMPALLPTISVRNIYCSYHRRRKGQAAGRKVEWLDSDVCSRKNPGLLLHSSV